MNIENIVNSMLQDDNLTLNILANISNDNEITDKIKGRIASLSPNEIAIINSRLERIL